VGSNPAAPTNTIRTLGDAAEHQKLAQLLIGYSQNAILMG
jgi:hypothetical protein